MSNELKMPSFENTKEKILVATTNPAKKKYLEWVVKDLGFDIVFFE